MNFAEKENSFELSIIGYQFPDMISELYDSNWLVVQINVSDMRGTWSVSEPCLLTYEASRLADWFDKVNSGNLDKLRCDFLEPLISFRVIDKSQKRFLRIRFMIEALPAWARDQYEYFMEFALSEIDLESASDDLRKQLEKYPQRAAR